MFRTVSEPIIFIGDFEKQPALGRVGRALGIKPNLARLFAEALRRRERRWYGLHDLSHKTGGYHGRVC